MGRVQKQSACLEQVILAEAKFGALNWGVGKPRGPKGRRSGSRSQVRKREKVGIGGERIPGFCSGKDRSLSWRALSSAPVLCRRRARRGAAEARRAAGSEGGARPPRACSCARAPRALGWAWLGLAGPGGARAGAVLRGGQGGLSAATSGQPASNTEALGDRVQCTRWPRAPALRERHCQPRRRCL